MSNKRKQIDDSFYFGENKKIKRSSSEDEYDDDEIATIILDVSFSNTYLKKKFETISKSTIRWIYNKEIINTQFIPIEFSNDYDYVKKSVSKKGELLRFASLELRNNREIVTIAVLDSPWIMHRISSDLKEDQEFILELISKTPDGKGFEFASLDLKMNAEFVLKCLKVNGYVIKLTPPRIRTREFLLKAVDQGGNHVEYVIGFAMGYVPELGSDRDFVLKSIGRCGSLLEHVCEEFRNDKEIVYRATINDERAFLFASDELKKDREFVLKCVKNQGNILSYADNDITSDWNFIFECIKQNGQALEGTPLSYRFDEYLKLQALSLHGFLSQTDYSANYRDLRIEYEYPELLELDSFKSVAQNSASK